MIPRIPMRGKDGFYMKEITISNEQAREFALEIFDVLIRDIKEQSETSVDTPFYEERRVA